jgi:leucyl aminopeptidase
VTFDSGGISIKPSGKMDEMRADMGGAACVLATLKAAATLKIPINIRGKLNKFGKLIFNHVIFLRSDSTL